MSRPKAFDTDNLKLTRALAQELADHLRPEGACKIYEPDPGVRHIQVEVRGRQGTTPISVARVAWALAHPEDHVLATEMVIAICGHGGDNTGRGVCCAPEHLLKMPAKDVEIYIARKMQEQRWRKTA